MVALQRRGRARSGRKGKFAPAGVFSAPPQYACSAHVKRRYCPSGLGPVTSKQSENGQVFARMIVCIAELRDTKIQGPRFLALVDRWIEIDEMQAGLAGRVEQNFHVALAVKGAAVADVVVVVRPPRRYWRSRSSPPSLQVDHEEGARRSSARVKRQRTWCDPAHRRFPASA